MRPAQAARWASNSAPLAIVEHVERGAGTRVDVHQVRGASREQEVEGDEADEIEGGADTLHGRAHGGVGGGWQFDGADSPAVAVRARAAAYGPLPGEPDDLHAAAGGDGKYRERLAVEAALEVASRAALDMRPRQ